MAAGETGASENGQLFVFAVAEELISQTAAEIADDHDNGPELDPGVTPPSTNLR
jgi:hypothetical protein